MLRPFSEQEPGHVDLGAVVVAGGRLDEFAVGAVLHRRTMRLAL